MQVNQSLAKVCRTISKLNVWLALNNTYDRPYKLQSMFDTAYIIQVKCQPC